METDKIPEINLELTTVKVEPEVRTLRTNTKIVYGIPLIRVHKSCRKQMGLSNPIKYWLWQRWMKKNWNKNNKLNDGKGT